MPEDHVPRGPLSARRPRDDDTLTESDSIRQAVGYLAMTVVACAAIALVYALVSLTQANDPVLDPPREIAPPPIDERILVQAVTAGVVAAIGSPQPLRGEIVFLEPTPTHTPARPTVVATAGPMTCPDNPNVLPAGSICLGKAPLPTPTVMPSCVAPPVPTVVCMVRSSVSPATPIPLLPTPRAEREGDHVR